MKPYHSQRKIFKVLIFYSMACYVNGIQICVGVA